MDNIEVVKCFLEDVGTNVIRGTVAVETTWGIYRNSEIIVTVTYNDNGYYNIVVPFSGNEVYGRLYKAGEILEMYNTIICNVSYSSIFKCLTLEHNNKIIRIYA